MEELPLPSLFDQASKIHLKATESGSNDKELVKKGIEALENCEEMISKLGLFSSNETKEDISTTNLKYILVPLYLAELTENIAQDDRIQILKASQAKLKEFLSFCEAMELVPEEELQTFSQGTPNTFADRRALKIARYRRQIAAEAKLEKIKEQKVRRFHSTKAAAVSTLVEAGEEDLLDDDGEEEREAWIITISLAICKAIDLLEMLKKEEEMLSAVKERQLKGGEKAFSQMILDERARKAEDWHRDAAVKARYTQPALPITCATFAQDVLEGRAKVSEAHDHKHLPVTFGPASIVGGSLSNERERMTAQVFQPGHRLPTMSIEEAGLKEMEIMNKWQERNVKFMEEASSAWYKDNQKLKPSEEEDEDDDDAAVQKARAFDDWKDDHPRGAGNKKLTPCG
ncbi:PREDICTED: PP2A regulatory subunit TAP46 [Populus euphratica]|uniref:PP2A regulatory subunit TAP46 n=1 Tax=Populus euphratica TaxID=75702 RepID=A0AAJ6VB78_POPEU|nr:PREDICTED: PP2A regulatory subunit TAP46 [Populus euphratica]